MAACHLHAEGDVGMFYRQPSDACEDLMAFIRTTDRVSEVVIVLANPTAAPVKVGCPVSWREATKDHRRIRNTAVRTLPKFNMEPENDGFQKESPFPGVDFQVPC